MNGGLKRLPPNVSSLFLPTDNHSTPHPVEGAESRRDLLHALIRPLPSYLHRLPIAGCCLRSSY